MLVGQDYFTKTNNLFSKILLTDDFKKEIVIIDENNEHKDSIMGLIKNGLYPYLERNIKISFMDINHIDYSIKNKIICVPIAFERINIPQWIKLANNNIVIASWDEELYYPWSLSNVIVANQSIHWAGQVNSEDTSVTGTSAYCAFLSILALKGKDFLLDFVKRVDQYGKIN